MDPVYLQYKLGGKVCVYGRMLTCSDSGRSEADNVQSNNPNERYEQSYASDFCPVDISTT